MTISNKTEFEELFQTHYAPLVGYATKIVRDEDGATDIVQSLFVSLWEERESIEVEGAIKSYLLRSTHNACLNHIKHEKIKQAQVDAAFFIQTI